MEIVKIEKTIKHARTAYSSVFCLLVAFVALSSLSKGGLHTMLIEVLCIPAATHLALTVFLIRRAFSNRAGWNLVIANQSLALIAFLLFAFIYLVGFVQTPRMDLFVIFAMLSSLLVFGLWLIYACVRMIRYQTQEE